MHVYIAGSGREVVPLELRCGTLHSLTGYGLHIACIHYICDNRYGITNNYEFKVTDKIVIQR